MKTTLCIRCETPLIATIAAYLAVRHLNLPEPSASASASAGNGKKKPPATWREVLALPEDAETFCECY